jgi:hypothetical protein
MSINQPLGPKPLNINLNLASRNPEVYAAAAAGQWTAEEQYVVNNIQNLLSLDKDLARTRDLSKARQRFQQLDPDIKGALVYLNPNAEYQLESEGMLKRLGNLALAAVKTPFRQVIAAADAWVNILPPSTPYRVARSVFDPNDDKNAFQKVLSSKTWSDGWNGVNQWDAKTTQKLEEKYGRAMSFLSKGIADGKKPSEIIREYGQMDADMANAVSQLSGNTKEWKQAFKEHKAYQVNVGNDLTNWANNNHPPKDGGVWSYIVPFALSPLGAAEVTKSKDGERWLVSNPNIFSDKKYVSPAGTINFTALLALDPLTYTTAGIGPATRTLNSSVKLAEKFIASSKSTVEKVDELFKVPAFAERHQRLANDVTELREARRARNYVKAGVIRTRIKQNFPEYDDDAVINLLTSTKVLDDQERLVNITDLTTMQRFFERGEYANYLINGKVNGGMFFRENQVALERRTRRLTDGIKAMYDEVFNGAARRVLNGEEPIPEKVFDKWDEFEKYFETKPDLTRLVDPNTDDVVKTLTRSERNLKRTVGNAFAIQPKNTQIFYKNGFVESSLDDFRNFTRLLVGDKIIANTLTERYLGLEPDERLNMLYSLYNLYLDKIGFASTAKGLERKRAILDGVFGGQGFGPIPKFNIPEHMASDALLGYQGGASQILHTTPGISMLKFDELLREVYDLNSGSVNRLLRYNGTGGLTNNALSRAANKAWAFFLLIPDLGWKSAADEALTFTMTAAPKQIVEFFNGKGRAASRALNAWTGSDKTQGLIKSRILDTLDRNPAKYVSPETRKAMQAPEMIDASYTLPNGKEIKVSELVSADELYGGTFEQRLAGIILAKYGSKLTDKEAAHLASFMMYNNQAVEAMVQSSVAASFANNMVDGTVAAEIYGKSTLTEALEAAGRKATGTYKNDIFGLLPDADKNLVQFASFYKYFGKNIWKNVDFGSSFIRYNALRTAEDTQAYIDDVMARIGYEKDSFGKWSVPKGSEQRVADFNSEFASTSELRNAGKTPAEITESIVRYSAAEMYTVFHGSDTAFNEKLLKAIKARVAKATEEVQKVKSFKARDAMRREAVGADTVPISKAEEARRQERNFKKVQPSAQVRNMSFQEFEQLIEGYAIKGEVRTDIDFPVLTDATSQFKKYGNIGWEVMDRQINDLYRTDAFNIKYLEQRSRLEPEELTYAKQLIASGVDETAAAIQADVYFTNFASRNAADELMKYADNPNVRTQLAFNMRVAGRFYRAVEDYTRRLVRFGTRHPDRVLYRLGHFSQSLEGTGLSYTDDNGTMYVMIPNDGLFWRSVAPVFAALMNPLGTAQALAGQNWDFFKQPAWNQYTLKISMLNPAYSEGAGVPTLTGPTLAIPILAARQLLTTYGMAKDNPLAIKIGDNLDNWLLGEQSDNTTWLRGLIPPNLLNAWGTLPIADKTGAMATSLYQAGAYLEVNEKTRMKPEDYLNDKKLTDYYNRLRLQAHNVVATKLGFNILSPVPIGSTEPGIPEELRRVGIVSFRQEFSDILRGVLSVNSEYGYNLQDPIGTAVSIFATENPDKLIYTVSKNSQQAQMAISYTEETKKWAINNTKLLKDYPSVAWVLAPHTGEYDPNTIYFLQAADLIPERDNVFDNNNAVFKRYLTETAAVRDRQRYFDVDREVQRLFNDPNNPQRNNATYRKDILEQAAATKQVIMAGNAALREALLNSEWETRQSLQTKFNNLSSMVNDPEYKENFARDKNEVVVENLKRMSNLAKRMLIVLEDTKIRGQFNADEVLEKVYRDGIENLENIVGANLTLGHAYSTIIRPLLDDTYSTPTVAIARP